MITVLHLADLHIGMENYGRIDPTSGLHSRLIDYLTALDEAITIGLDASVDLVLIAGDIYKNRTPNPTHQREFARRIARLRKAGIPLFMIVGNHDNAPSLGRAHAVEIFDTLGIDDVIVADRPGLHLLETRNGPVQIAALPWVTRNTIMTREDAQQGSFLEVETMLLSRVDEVLRGMAARRDPNIPLILAAHATIEGATTGVERQLMLGKDLMLPKSIIALPEFDYVALGHIHKHQVLSATPPVVYAGSIERIDFGEERETKGCVLVRLTPGHADWEFKPLDTRPFKTIHVDVRGNAEPHARVTTTIERTDVQNAVVQLVIEASAEQAPLFRTEELRAQLSARGAFHIATVKVEVERAGRSRLGEQARELLEDLTPRKALEIYLRSKNTDATRMGELLAAADELMERQVS